MNIQGLVSSWVDSSDLGNQNLLVAKAYRVNFAISGLFLGVNKGHTRWCFLMQPMSWLTSVAYRTYGEQISQLGRSEVCVIALLPRDSHSVGNVYSVDEIQHQDKQKYYTDIWAITRNRQHLSHAICEECSSRSACTVWPEKCLANVTLFYRLAESVANRIPTWSEAKAYMIAPYSKIFLCKPMTANSIKQKWLESNSLAFWIYAVCYSSVYLACIESIGNLNRQQTVFNLS